MFLIAELLQEAQTDHLLCIRKRKREPESERAGVRVMEGEETRR